MQGCSGNYILKSKNIKEVRDQTIRIIKGAGFRGFSRGSSKNHFKVEGIRGNQLLALLTNQVRWLRLFGIFSRVKVKILCQRSLNKAEEDLHLYVQVYPIMETREDREWGLFVSQDLEEVIGDNLQAKRCFKLISKGILRLGLKEPQRGQVSSKSGRDQFSREEASARKELYRAHRLLRTLRMIYIGFAVFFLVLIWAVSIIHSAKKIDTDFRNILVGFFAFMTILTILGAIQVVSYPRFWSFMIAAIWTLFWVSALAYFKFSTDSVVYGIFAVISAVSFWKGALSTRRITYLLRKYPDLIIAQKMLGKSRGS